MTTTTMIHSTDLVETYEGGDGDLRGTYEEAYEGDAGPSRGDHEAGTGPNESGTGP